jgi:hypothetical protein
MDYVIKTMLCKICGRECKNIKSLITHSKIHNYTSKSLYDAFYKKPNEGECLNCKKQTNYKNFNLGYNKFCSTKCAGKLNTTSYWKSNEEEVEQRRINHREKFKQHQNLNGRPKGSKNKNHYPITEKVLGRYKLFPPPSWEGKKHKEETKIKISIAHTGKIISNESRNKMSKTRSAKILSGEIVLNYNKKYTQGKFNIKNKEKYKGDYSNIVYRSSYELKFMQYCDLNESIDEWMSEEFYILYKDPFSGSTRRYFPDFFIKYKDKEGNIKKAVIEVKPKKDLREPEKNPKRKTRSWAYQVKTWAVNQQKWSAAEKYCEAKGWEFKIFTEDQLGIKL